MFDGKLKALTFSYDDGVLQDQRLIDIFNKYGLKGTFNLNSGLLGKQASLNLNGITVEHTRWKAEDIARVYDGHEIAVHTISHPHLPLLNEQEIIYQVEDDRQRLSELAGYEVYGMAYPSGGENNDDRVAGIIKESTGVRFARTITSTHSFAKQQNLYRFNPTVYHKEWNELQILVKEFVDLKPNEPALFYIWGHSYEFDKDNTWERFEEICRDLSNRNDIYYGTNRQVLGY